MDHAAPVIAAPGRPRIMLVGQAPGRVEEVAGRPFSGRAGRQLFRWLEQAGFGDEAAARRRIYLTSITKCFPGPALSGGGDRRPSPSEIALCSGFLDRQLELIRPRLLLAVGQLAIQRFLGRAAMGQLVGRVFDGSGRELPPSAGSPGGQLPLLLPLPHPSGASRWLNSEENRLLLQAGLWRLRELSEDRG